jgi:hypothetical protein
MFADSPDAGAQLLASNLQFLLRFLVERARQMAPMSPTGMLNSEQGAGGALFLTTVAQKRGNSL